MAISICVMAGVMVDIVTSLPDSLEVYKETEQWIPSEMEWHVAGAGANIAIAASSIGFSPVFLISKIGLQLDGQPDIAARFILDKLNKYNIKVLYAGDQSIITGTNMIIYRGENKRLIIADNRFEVSLNSTDISPEIIAAATQSDILFVSGYSLMSKSSAQATLLLMREVSRRGGSIALDVVPHKIHKHLSLEEFREYTELVDILITELNTIRHLYPSVAASEKEEIEKISSVLLKSQKMVILRTAQNMQYIFGSDGLSKAAKIDFPVGDVKQKRGFWDIESVRALIDHYSLYKKW